MEIKEVVVDAFTPAGRGVRRKDEIWHIVKFGNREFLMPKTASKEFTKNMRHEAEFSFYFDGNRLITNNKQHIPVDTMVQSLNERYFVVLKDDVELFKSENYTLLTNENGLALYMMNNYNSTFYRDGNIYRKINFPRKTITFDKEKPFNDETYNILERLSSYHKAKIIKINDKLAFFYIRILDYNDVKVYTTENASEYRIFLVENAEFAKVNDEMHLAIKGNQTYMLIDSLYTPTSRDITQIGTKTIEYNNNYEGYEYIIPNATKVLYKELKEYSIDETKTVFFESSITEIPSADCEIIVRKVIRKAEPVIKKDSNKLSHKLLEPEILEEKTYKIKDFVNKPAELSATW